MSNVLCQALEGAVMTVLAIAVMAAVVFVPAFVAAGVVSTLIDGRAFTETAATYQVVSVVMVIACSVFAYRQRLYMSQLHYGQSGRMLYWLETNVLMIAVVVVAVASQLFSTAVSCGLI